MKTLREPITSLFEYVRFVERVSKPLVLFRGQREDKPLLPMIARFDPRANIQETEIEMLSEFKMKSIPFVRDKPADDLEWLALARHHGTPTWSGLDYKPFSCPLVCCKKTTRGEEEWSCLDDLC